MVLSNDKEVHSAGQWLIVALDDVLAILFPLLSRARSCNFRFILSIFSFSLSFSLSFLLTFFLSFSLSLSLARALISVWL